MASFFSKTLKVSCRAGRLLLLRNNYKEHLRLKHPDEDYNDLRTANQTTISSLLARGTLRGTLRGTVKRSIETEVESTSFTL